MACRAPSLIRRQYRPTDATAQDAVGAILALIPGKDFVAIEMGPRSEIDTVVLKTPHGDRVCAVGSPVLGPFDDMVEVKPFHTIPWATGVTAYLGDNLTGGKTLPIVELVCHYQLPPAWLRKRAPAKYKNRSKATTISTLLRILEVPIYGRKRATVVIQNGALATTTWSIRGVRYEDSNTGVGGTGEVAVIGGVEPINTQLALDSGGSLTTTLTTAAQTKSFTLIDESWDTLWVECTDDGTSRTLSAWATAEDE